MREGERERGSQNDEPRRERWFSKIVDIRKHGREKGGKKDFVASSLTSIVCLFTLPSMMYRTEKP